MIYLYTHKKGINNFTKHLNFIKKIKYKHVAYYAFNRRLEDIDLETYNLVFECAGETEEEALEEIAFFRQPHYKPRYRLYNGKKLVAVGKKSEIAQKAHVAISTITAIEEGYATKRYENYWLEWIGADER